MMFKSTRDSSLRLSASEVITQGISEEGGLFVPESFPKVENLSKWAELDYLSLAKELLALYLTDFSKEEIAGCVDRAYDKSRFGGKEPVSFAYVSEGRDDEKCFLELWHGPTCAFKDMALQLLPQLLTTAIKKSGQNKTALILVSTSGDTGKAALEGFRDVDGVKLISFYPKDGVSKMQWMQMATQAGNNLRVCAVEGNFDDTQTTMKKIFIDSEIKKLAAENNMMFSSANSINFGRLLPQIIYYFYSYFELYNKGRLKSLKEEINFVVPTGNFGNILAGFYAKMMGLPIKKLICASNKNNVLTDFINSGSYDSNREFFLTSSPSMDILVSSNLERLLYHLSAENTEAVKGWMKSLAVEGIYNTDMDTAKRVQQLFYGGFCDEAATLESIDSLFNVEGYLSDTHTAVAASVYKRYLEETGDSSKAVIVSTASPYKFPDSVLEALGQPVPENPFRQMEALEACTATKIPARLKDLENKKIRFEDCVSKPEMADYVKRYIHSWGEED